MAVRVIEVRENIFAANDRAADELRSRLSAAGIFMLNVMSSPGSGKTTALTAIINRLKDRLNIAEMDVDIETSFDAQKVADATGVKSLQIHNGGLCHIDAEMTTRAINEFKEEIGTEEFEALDLLILENIGNLVCPAEFDTGAHKNMMILSVPEGDDKPLKYPLMFSVCDAVLISKMDTLEYFDFDIEKARENIRRLNRDAEIFPVSAKTGAGIDDVCSWIMKQTGKRY